MEWGKFSIVGMGPYPDLVTVRAVRTIAEADTLILKSEEDKIRWSDYIQGKPVWLCPHETRLGLGIDPETVEEPTLRAFIAQNARLRREITDQIRAAVQQGKRVAALEVGDPMLYGTTYYLEYLEDLATEVIPGISSYQAGCAALKKSPTFGWDTSAVILTMDDWEGRKDKNQALMQSGSSLVLFAIAPDYPALFSEFSRHYPPETPVAVVAYAGDPSRETIQKSTVANFLREIAASALPVGMHLLFVGKFLELGQARKDGLKGAERYLKRFGRV